MARGLVLSIVNLQKNAKNVTAICVIVALMIIIIRLLPHHNNVWTKTVVVVVVHTPHSILKNDSTCTIIRTSKCTIQMMPNPKKIEKNFGKKNSKVF